MSDSDSDSDSNCSLTPEDIQFNTLRSDRRLIRGIILYEVRLESLTISTRTAIFSAFEKFQSAVGYDVMTFREFEFWFYRFKKGETDLDADIGPDESFRNLTEMPKEVLEIITKDFSLKEQIRFGRVCQSFKDFMNGQKPKLRDISIHSQRYSLDAEFDGYSCRYSEWPYELIHLDINNGFNMNPVENIEEPEPMLEELKSDLLVFFKNPKLSLRSMYLGYEYGRNIDELLEFFEQFENKISVKSFAISGPIRKDVFPVLRICKPEILEEINFSVCPKNKEDSTKTVYDITEYIELEQWKKAKILKIKNGVTVQIAMDSLKNFVNFGIMLKSISEKEAQELRDIFLNSAHFEAGFIRFQEDADIENISKSLGKLQENSQSFPQVFKFSSISGQDLEFKFERKSLKITKGTAKLDKEFEDFNNMYFYEKLKIYEKRESLEAAERYDDIYH